VKDILSLVPPHDCAHGFTRARSIKTYSQPHLKQQVVLRMDLKDFFHSVPIARITALFRRLGYPPTAARALKGFCTNSVSPSLAGKPFEKLSWEEKKRLQSKHLPQGAPTSAPLANLCAWKLDCRLAGLADRYGYQYTRYADDLAFSGPSSLARRAEFIETLVGAIVIEEGFRLNHRKTRLRLASQRQRLAGVVVNEKANYARADWDRLKAVLYNCVKHGPESQNRNNHPDFKAHLKGCVAHVSWLNPSRGEKLQALLKQIVW
jgi:retron-type reverse transcriptase